jgi:site-specific recombinase XerC
MKYWPFCGASDYAESYTHFSERSAQDSVPLGIIRFAELCLLFRYRNNRHSFAVHRLERWYRSGEDLNAKLPLLATYLGHKSLVGTQAYLQLTRTIHTDIADKLEAQYGFVIPLESS